MADHVSIINPPRAPASLPVDPLESRVAADGWWPSILISEFRATMRVDEAITPIRCRHALRTAIATALIDLGEWGILQRAQGYASLSLVPSVEIDGVSHYVLCWQRAIMSLAKAELVETHRDYDATGAGARNTDFVDDTIVQLRRDGAHAIRDLKGRGRTTMELI